MSILPKNEIDYEINIRNIVVQNKNLDEEVEKGLVYKKCSFLNCKSNQTMNFESTIFIECTFRNLDSNGTNFSKNIFINCSFCDCKLENIIFTENNFNKTLFRGSNLLNCDFTESGYFGVVFDSCILNSINFSNSYFDEKSLLNYNCFVDNIDLSNSTVNWNNHKWIECILLNYTTTDEEKNLVKQISNDRDRCWGKLNDTRNKHVKKAFKSLATWYKKNNNKGHFVPNAIKNMAKNIED